jgi:hypothetical protein
MIAMVNLTSWIRSSAHSTCSVLANGVRIYPVFSQSLDDRLIRADKKRLAAYSDAAVARNQRDLTFFPRTLS